MPYPNLYSRLPRSRVPNQLVYNPGVASSLLCASQSLNRASDILHALGQGDPRTAAPRVKAGPFPLAMFRRAARESKTNLGASGAGPFGSKVVERHVRAHVSVRRTYSFYTAHTHYAPHRRGWLRVAPNSLEPSFRPSSCHNVETEISISGYVAALREAYGCYTSARATLVKAKGGNSKEEVKFWYNLEACLEQCNLAFGGLNWLIGQV